MTQNRTKKVSEIEFARLLDRLDEVSQNLKELQPRFALAADALTGSEDRIDKLSCLRGYYLRTLSKKYRTEPGYVRCLVNGSEYMLLEQNEIKIQQAVKELNLAKFTHDQVKLEIDTLNSTSKAIAREMLKFDLV